MAERVGSDYRFDDLILMEEFDLAGKQWLSFLLIPQEHLQDLLKEPGCIKPGEAYGKQQEFWDRLSELTSDFYRNYLESQGTAPNGGGGAASGFNGRNSYRLEAALRAFDSKTNQLFRLSVVAQSPVF